MPMRSPTLSPRRTMPRATASQLSLYWRQEISRAGSTQRSTIAGRSSWRYSIPMVPRFLTIHMHDDLAEHAALFEHADAFGGLFQLEFLFHDRMERLPRHKIQTGLDVLGQVGARADDIHLAEPNEADIDGAQVADGRAAGEDAAVDRHAALGRDPGIAAGEVHR